MGVGDLVETEHRHAPTGQAPGDVLERLVAPDRLVAVKRSGAGEEHDAGQRSGAARHAQSAAHRQRPGPDGELALVKPARVGVGRGLPRRDRRRRIRRRQLQADQLAHVIDHRDHREAAALAAHEQLHHDDTRRAGLAQRRADRRDRAIPGQFCVPRALERLGHDHRLQVRCEQCADVVKASGLRQVECGQGSMLGCGQHQKLLSRPYPRSGSAERLQPGAGQQVVGGEGVGVGPHELDEAAPATSGVSGSAERSGVLLLGLAVASRVGPDGGPAEVGERASVAGSTAVKRDAQTGALGLVLGVGRDEALRGLGAGVATAQRRALRARRRC